MKLFKNSLIFIIVLSMLFTVSCTDTSINDNNTEQCAAYPTLSAEFDATYTLGDFLVTVDSINPDFSSTEISLTCKNSTDKLASFEKSFKIEKFHDGHWDSCQTEEPDFSSIETGIPAGDSAQATYNWGKYFDIKEPGTYRFITNIINDAAGARDKKELSVEFIVSYDKIIPVLQNYEIAEGSAFISVLWKNNSDDSIYLTDFYSVEAFVDNEWIECNRTENEFTASLFAIAPGESDEKHYAINEMYELNYYGNYRVFLEYAVDNGENTEKRCAMVEFFIPLVIEVNE